MVRLVKILKSLSLLKGSIFTVIGLGVIGLAGYLMWTEKSVTDGGIELLILGLLLAGVNADTISHIRGNSDSKP